MTKAPSVEIVPEQFIQLYDRMKKHEETLFSALKSIFNVEKNLDKLTLMDQKFAGSIAHDNRMHEVSKIYLKDVATRVDALKVSFEELRKLIPVNCEKGSSTSIDRNLV